MTMIRDKSPRFPCAKARTTLLATLFGIGTAASVQAQDRTIAFFASISQNGLNQAMYQGMQDRAAELGVRTSLYDGQFNPGLQYSQLEDVVAGNQADAAVVFPIDSVGIAGAAAEMAAAGVPIVAMMFPIGPELDRLEPQVPGVVTTIGFSTVGTSVQQAEDVARHCAGIDPCNVVVMVGRMVYPFDQLRFDAYASVLDQHPNIHLVATVEGNYDPSTALAVMEDVLQANRDVHAVLSVADQHLIGVEIALEAAGIDVAPVYLSGAGGASIAIEAIREGRWDATVGGFPYTMGRIAVDAAMASLNGDTVPPVRDMEALAPLPTIIDRAILDAHPEFQAEWLQ